MTAEPLLIGRTVSLGYHQQVLIRGLSFEIGHGEILGIVGLNGSVDSCAAIAFNTRPDESADAAARWLAAAGRAVAVLAKIHRSIRPQYLTKLGHRIARFSWHLTPVTSSVF